MDQLDRGFTPVDKESKCYFFNKGHKKKLQYIQSHQSSLVAWVRRKMYLLSITLRSVGLSGGRALPLHVYQDRGMLTVIN